MIEKILNDAGYTTVIGYGETMSAIKVVADSSFISRCSGYRVFPNGDKCLGCPDCLEKKTGGTNSRWEAEQ